MEKVVEALIKEVPGLAIVGFIVWVFVKYLVQSSHSVRDVHKETMERMEKMTDALAGTAKDCHANQITATRALERNSESLDRFGDKLGHLTDVVEARYTNGGVR